LGVITGKPKDITQDVEAIQGVIAGEHAGIAAYRIAAASGLLVPETLKIAQLFMSHHEAHRDAMAKLIRDIGTTPVEPKTDAEYISMLKIDTLKTQAEILTLATTLERLAATGYISHMSAIRDPGLAQIFAQISADEVIHWTTLNAATNGALPADPFEFG